MSVIRTFLGHEGDVSAVKFFPSGNRLKLTPMIEFAGCLIRTGHQLQVYQQQHTENGTAWVASFLLDTLMVIDMIGILYWPR
ncbi:hypothetical protein PIB30_052137 [Stylosanthes scabra]|uniref:Uncharacterized protein n=1 Tax=Stylosanthes scabra TaxID=79078 RepID=A0ABU6XH82_9FABA|nr:hypothetical protein [Stylosanthes scabra]